ncbi:MAG: interleukin-like EMT inducer domain-containing protein, partial [Thermoanaerobaculia bacterium]
AEVDRRTQGKRTVIAYSGWNQPYPYVGSRLQNRVEFVPTTSRGPSPYYTWRGDVETGRSGGSLVEWLQNLRSAGVGYVVAEGPPSGSLEATWVALVRDAFVPLAFDGWAVLSRVREGSEAEPPRLALLAESDAAGSFLDRRTGLGRDAAAAGKPAFVIPAAGGGFLFPPTGLQFQWLQIELASGPAPPEPVAVLINGQEVGRLPPASSAGKIRFSIPAGAWGGENTIELSPVGVGKQPYARAWIGATEIETRTPLSAESFAFWAGSRAVLRAGAEKVVRSGTGYHLALLSRELDRIAHVRSFDTCRSREASDELSTFVEGLAPGTVVLGAVSDDGSRSLSARAVAALESLGCAVDLRDRFRQSHAFIGVKGAANGTVPEWSGLSPSRVIAGPELVRVAALEFFSGAGPEAKAWTPADGPLPPHTLYREDPTLVGSIDEPAENAVVTGPLRVQGWARIPGEDLHVTVTIDGERRSFVAGGRVPRPGVQAALPSLGNCRTAGYEATYVFETDDEGAHEIRVLFQAADGRQRHYPPRRFTWKKGL